MARQFSLAVVGADFPNRTGPGRRFEIALCKPGERVELRPEPKNPHDSRAVAVYSKRGIQLGYLSADRAPLVGRQMEKREVRAVFQQPERWGASIRIAYDGTDPVLPPRGDLEDAEWPPPGSDDPDWWPDETFPD